jgi:hypothetical protein
LLNNPAIKIRATPRTHKIDILHWVDQGMDDWRIVVQFAAVAREIFLFSEKPDRLWDAPPAPYNWNRWFFPGGKAAAVRRWPINST